MKKQNKDVLSGSEFTKIITPEKKHHFSLPSEVIPEDENVDQFKETLVGMEYDIEAKESATETESENETEVSDEDQEYLLSNEEIFQENYDEEDEDYYLSEEEIDEAQKVEATP